MSRPSNANLRSKDLTTAMDDLAGGDKAVADALNDAGKVLDNRSDLYDHPETGCARSEPSIGRRLLPAEVDTRVISCERRHLV